MIAVFYSKHGGLDVLQVGELPTPTPGPGQVQIRLHAAALNRLDLWTLQGWPGLKLEMPHIPGADGAGVITDLGEGVSQIAEGDRVVINSNLSCGFCEFCLAGEDNRCRDWHLLGESVKGTFAEYVVVPATNALPIPEDFSFEQAAAAGLVFHTAWHSLITRGCLRPGESVLIIGASGGVNTACIQIAKYAGAEVYVVGSNAEKLALAESLGAKVLINRSQVQNWSKEVFLATDRKGVDVVVDNVGAGTMPLSLRAAKKGGRILTVGNTAGPKFEIDNRFIFGKHLSLIGSTMGTHADFAAVMKLVFEGKVSPAMDRSFPSNQAAKALARLDAGEQMGKITLQMN